MVKQYPDSIEIKIEGGDPVQVGGVWTKPDPQIFKSECRSEPNKGNAVIKTSDGAQTYFDFNVYMPKTSTEIPVGSKFTLERFDGLTVNGFVKRAHNGQMNSRVWV